MLDGAARAQERREEHVAAYTSCDLVMCGDGEVGKDVLVDLESKLGGQLLQDSEWRCWL